MPHQIVPPKHRAFARSMRHKATEPELRLWNQLRDRRLGEVKFRRQVPIGGYIADFLCVEAKLIIELDGSQHAESAYDAERDSELKQRGFRVLRFWNDDVMRDLDNVCGTILAFVRDHSLQPWRRCAGLFFFDKVGRARSATRLLPLWEKTSPKATDEGCLRQAGGPLIRLGARAPIHLLPQGEKMEPVLLLLITIFRVEE